MDYRPIINELEGRVANLNNVIATLRMLQAGDAVLNPQEPAITEEPAAEKTSKRKKMPGRKIAAPAKDKEAKRNKRSFILNYLQGHPNSGAKEIAKALGFARSAIAFHLLDAKKEGLVARQGSTHNSRWSLVKNGAKSTAPSTSSGNLECRLCHAPASSPEKLASHMRIVHNTSQA